MILEIYYELSGFKGPSEKIHYLWSGDAEKSEMFEGVVLGLYRVGKYRKVIRWRPMGERNSRNT